MGRWRLLQAGVLAKLTMQLVEVLEHHTSVGSPKAPALSLCPEYLRHAARLSLFILGNEKESWHGSVRRSIQGTPFPVG
ncbi:hypothetical protein BC835DRAFT_833697 [Cytidiella melzeri]|nr:hypothetical protein BC835DRAFT_833697 [Cytidiella melzeri]